MLASLTLTLAAAAAVFWLFAGTVVIALCRMAATSDAALRRAAAAPRSAALATAPSQALPREYVANGPH